MQADISPIKVKDGATKAALKETGAKNTASADKKKVKSNAFALWFPVLDQMVSNLGQLTGFEDFKLSLKFASDEELSVGTRSFYLTKM